jgi:circadian clock protein KaiB
MAKKSANIDSTAEIEKAAKIARKSEKYVLRLYVAGISVRSSAAIHNVTALCDENLKDRYELEIIDIYQQPTLAKGEQIIAVPTLIKKLPQPLRRFIGDMADKDRILFGLDLRPKE